MAASRPSLPPCFLEALEPRIAPATVVNVGADSSSIGYNDAPFIKASAAPDPSVQKLFDGSSDHYYLNLGPKSVVRFYDGPDGYKDYIKLDAGRVFAFFFDANRDTVVQKNELSGFAVAQGTRLIVDGAVNGDIVGSLNGKTQLLSPISLPAKTQDLLDVSVAKLSIDGDVNGRIITGGNISNVSVKNVEQITTASTGNYTFDWSGGSVVPPGVGKAQLNSFTPNPGKSGGNITGVSVAVLDDPTPGARGAIIAGIGGTGGAGGSISGVTVVSDPNGFLIQAGKGGDGPSGGKGGGVQNLVVNFVEGSKANPDLIEVRAGQGGDATAGSGKAGGAGGSLAGLSIGYNKSGRLLVETPLGDYVQIYAGRGGNGDIGGPGGSIKDAKTAIDVTIPGPTPEFLADAGDGGNGTRRDGVGGSITNLIARNFNVLTNDDALLVSAGNGGAGGGGSAAGGSIRQVTVLADLVTIDAGNGSAGAKGGAGGSVKNVVLDVLPNTDWINVAQISGGDGGRGASGAGGAGGSVSGVTAKSVDFDATAKSQIAGGNGGISTSGRGGAGGAVSAVKIAETVPFAVQANFEVVGGAGGAGGAGGGAGGGLKGITFQGFATSVLFLAGAGGDATVKGPGGAGGGVASAALQVLLGSPVGPGRVLAGEGGDAAGLGGRAGKGGGVSSATVLYGGNVAEVRGGNGGSDGVGGTSSSAVGAGGSVSRTVLAALGPLGKATLLAGSAGTPVAAGVGAAGGSVANVSVSATVDVTVGGGNGRAGGGGGSVSKVSWFGATGGQPDPGAAPTGLINVSGGQGSVGPRTAGAGGSVIDARGFASGTPGVDTLVRAGDGNGGTAGSKSGAGGSVSRVSFFGGVGEIKIIAGNGGNLDPAQAVARTAAAGGSVTGVSAVDGTNVRVVAAGEGGDAGFASGRGGRGGSVQSVDVDGDIGRRTGQVFGFDTMGGIFAGSGGSGDPGASGALNGRSGNVQKITADAISSIVAGRPSSLSPFDFSMVSLIDRVQLRGLAAPTVQSNGAFDVVSAPGVGVNPPTVAYAEANLVGAVAGAVNAPGANVFKVQVGGVPTAVPAEQLPMRSAAGGGFEYNNPPATGVWSSFRPIDGFVAAQQLGVSKNFRPEAILTLTNPRDPNSLSFLDYRNDINRNS